MKNNLIKAAYAESEYNPERIRELHRCRKDPIYFICNYIYLQHPVKGKMLFKLYDYQKDLINSLHENDRVISLISRQMGKCFSGSTTINTIVKPNWLKLSILRIVDKEIYNRVKDL